MSDRVTRPIPERSDPIRSWSALFTAPGAGPAGPANDVVTRTVAAGYRVVDEYLRQGERVARAIAGTSPTPGAPGRDVQDLVTRMAQYAQDFMGVWMQLLELAAGGAMPRPPAASTNGGAATVAAPSAPVEPLRVTVAVTSARPVEVTVELRPDAAGAELVVHDLRAATSELPRIGGVTLESGDPPRLRLLVPETQPAGTYHGVVVDARTSRAVGTVSVRVPA